MIHFGNRRIVALVKTIDDLYLYEIAIFFLQLARGDSHFLAFQTIAANLNNRRHSFYNAGALKPRSRSELVTTNTDENAIAAAAIIGLSKMPKNGYKTPAAIGMPRML